MSEPLYKRKFHLGFRHLLLLLALLLVIYFQYLLWFGHGGIMEHRALKTVLAVQTAKNAQLKDRNDVLAAEVDDLKNGNMAVEEHARLDLGLIKAGETFIQINTAE